MRLITIAAAMLATFTRERLAAAGPTDVSDSLEDGKIVHFPESPISLPESSDQAFLRDESAKHLKKKNISYYPSADKVVGIKGNPEARSRTHRILKEHTGRVQEFLKRIMPGFVANWDLGTSSFRPLQEKGRDLSAHASNELVHVDAGAYGATHGNRILRFFVNINPSEDRVWITKGAFPDLYRRYGQLAGIAPENRPPGSLEEGVANRIWSGLVSTATGLGWRMARMADTSPYDRMMRVFHNYMKDSSDFQATSEGHQQFDFKPFSAWMVLTDMVSHACISGQHALVDTFLIPLENCRLKERAPYYILKGSS